MQKNLASQYGILLKILCDPVPWFKWVGMLGVLMVGLNFLTQGDWQHSIMAILGAVLILLFGFVVIFLLPPQVIALMTSKQFSLLANLHHYSLKILLLASVIFSVLIALSFCFSKNTCSGVAVLCTAWCCTSVYLTASIYFLRFSPLCTLLVVPIVWVQTLFAPWLMLQSVWLVLGIGIVVWMVFVGWWLAWRPTRYVKFVLAMHPTETQENISLEYFWQWLNTPFKSKPKSLIGTLLFGRIDGWKNQLMQGSLVALAVLFMVGFMVLIFDHNTLQNIVNGTGGTLIFVYVFGVASTLQTKIYFNLYKTWLFFDFSRRNLFFEVEVKFYTAFIANILPSILVLLVFEFIYVVSLLNFLYGVVLIIIQSLLVAAIYYYVVLLVYLKTKATNWFTLINMAAMLVLPMLNYFLQAQVKQYVELQQVLVWCVALVSCALVIIYGLRVWAIALWSRADFMQVKG